MKKIVGATILFVVFVSFAFPANAESVTLSRNLTIGSTGQDVVLVQNTLWKLGYYKGQQSGTFDTSTKTALVAFQKKAGVVAKGRTPANTRKLINDIAAGTISLAKYSIVTSTTPSTGTNTTTPPTTTTPVTPTPPKPTPTPTLTFNASSTSFISGKATNISWSATNATSCSASGAWAGSKGTSGSVSTGNLTATSTYSLSCTGTGGTVAKTIVVNVLPPVVPEIADGSCSPSVSAVNTGTSVTWKLTAPTGGTGSYSYIWSGSDSLAGTGSSISKTYTSAGSKIASVAISSGSKVRIIACTPSLTVSAPAPVVVVTPSVGTTTIQQVGAITGAQQSTTSIMYRFTAVPMDKNYQVFVHVLNSTGSIVFQDDHTLPNGLSTKTWSGNISYTRTVTIPANVPVGTYTITAGILENVSGYPKKTLALGTGVTQKWPNEYIVGTMTVTQGVNLPTTPKVLPALGYPVKTAVPGSGDPLAGAVYTDDHHPSSYPLAFHDEFNGSSLNTKTWSNELLWGDHSLGDEKECYLDKNVTVGAGNVTFNALKEPVFCPKPAFVAPYTSGMLNSSKSYVQKYGYFVMRAKLPAGKGFWSAFWLMPADASWPPEIDIMEVLGHTPKTTYTTYHYKDANGSNQSSGKGTVGPDSSDGYHLYAVDWQPGKIIWYVDGVEVYRYTNANVVDKPAYILTNLSVGGSWPGSPDANTVFPNKMDVDYIRAYALAPASVATTTATTTTTTTTIAPQSTSQLSAGVASAPGAQIVQTVTRKYWRLFEQKILGV